MNNIFKGTGVALVTPFNANCGIDFIALDRLVRKVVKGNVDFLLALGTTAEAVAMNSEEKSAVVAQIIESNDGQLPILLGMGGNNTAQLVKDIKAINTEGIDGLLSVAPYYNKPNQKGIYQHFKEVSYATNLPIILYNVPGRTASNILPETAIKLAEDFENIVAIKEASGSMEQVMELVKSSPKGFKIFSGEDALTMPMMAVGVHGVISVIANAYPNTMSEMVNIMLNKGDIARAKKLHYDMLDLINAIFADGNPAGVKSLLEYKGEMVNSLRLPMVKANRAVSNELKRLEDFTNLS
ncbi:MAG: 4-hydroxy-tetrahydrodipicolinate synthase [Bacteroidales bacterium]|nr:4-hydroxy-tetrahydrodipicolinate synthase [Bacteroidales bacterium]